MVQTLFISKLESHLDPEPKQLSEHGAWRLWLNWMYTMRSSTRFCNARTMYLYKINVCFRWSQKSCLLQLVIDGVFDFLSFPPILQGYSNNGICLDLCSTITISLSTIDGIIQFVEIFQRALTLSFLLSDTNFLNGQLHLFR